MTKTITKALPADINLTHLDKVFWPEEGYTKGDVIEYYHKIAPILLPHLVDRPQSLHRHPNGINGKSFFHKDLKPPIPSWIHLKEIDHVHYLLIQDERSLLYAANMGCIELNPFLSRIGSIDFPDYMVIDLDPQDVPFSLVVKIALAIHDLLKQAHIPCYCKTSGSRGMHVCVPLKAQYSFEQSKAFAELIAHIIHNQFPEETSIERKPIKRKKRLYLDYLQNRSHQTLAAPYCIRPRPKATVSTPLAWEEVTEDLDPTTFTIRTIFKRLEKVGDLWKPDTVKGINLPACLNKLESIWKAR